MPRRRLDLTGHLCPYPFVKSILALEEMAAGDELEVLVDHEPAVRNTPRSLEIYGHAVTEIQEMGQTWLLTIRKGPAKG